MKLLPTLNIKTKLKDSSTAIADVASSVIQIGFPGSGSVICFAVGKVVVGLILAVITFAVVMRLMWRRKRAAHVLKTESLPLWAKLTAFIFALASSAAMVEMTQLPVRFDQPGFAMSNWLIVILAIALLNVWCRSVFKDWLRRKA